MNLLFAINRDFVGLFMHCMRSIIKNGGAPFYEAYILHSDLEAEQTDAIRALEGPGLRFHFVAVDPQLFEGFPVTKRYPLQIYYRIAAPYLLPEQLDRILYLDVDLVVINPLAPLYEMPFDGAYYIACTHTGELLTRLNRTRLGAEKGAPYINTGVMVLNLTALRENLRLDAVRDYANAKKYSLILPDQDILTALYGHNVKLADTLRYNLNDRILNLYNMDPTNPLLDLEWVRSNAAILHYFGKNKPWKESYTGILGGLYWEAAEEA